MKVRIEHLYPIRYIPYRHQNQRAVHGAAVTEVFIREIEGNAAPIAFLVGNDDGDGDYGTYTRIFDRRKDGGLREIRQHEGRLYVEEEPAELLQARCDENVRHSAFFPCDVHQQSKDPKKTEKVWTGDALVRAQANPARSIQDDLGASVSANLARRAERLLIIDGIVFQECPEPILHIGSSDNVCRIGRRPSRNRWSRILSRRDGLNERLTEAERLIESGLGTRLSEEPPRCSCRWEVVDPRWSTFNGTANDVCRLAEECMQTLAFRAGGLPRHALDVMYVLRDALEEATQGATTRLTDALAEVSRLKVDAADKEKAALIHSWHRHGLDRFGINGPSGYDSRKALYDSRAIDNVASTAALAVARWTIRPPGDEWVPPARSSAADEISDGDQITTIPGDRYPIPSHP